MDCYCTLFDSAYLDKGIVLAQSLFKVNLNSILYIFAFDDKCYNVLKELDMPGTFIISLEEFETGDLKNIKKQRSARTYCWTCTPFVIKHVLDYYHEESCTYIDADMYFFGNPQTLIDEIKDAKCDVGIVEHRYGDGYYQKQQLESSGKYCVQFNTFFNNENGRRVLNWWADKCYDCCSEYYQDGNLGDQMYLNDWTERFDGVHELQNQGGGVAPWNIYRYRLLSDNGADIDLYDILKKEKFKLIFFHFHGIHYLSNVEIDVGIYGRYGYPQKKLVNLLYSIYMKKIDEIREMLSEKYKLDLYADIENDQTEEHEKALYSIKKQIREEGILPLLVHVRNSVRYRIRHSRDKMRIRI